MSPRLNCGSCCASTAISARVMSLPSRPRGLDPPLGELAGIVESLLLPGTVVAAVADAIALRRARNHIRQLEALGYTVTITQAA